MTDATPKKSNTTWYIVAAIIVIIIVVGGVLAYIFTQPGGGGGVTLTGTNIDIYAGDYKFATGADLASTRPTMILTAGQSVTVTLHNVGAMDHNWAIVTQKTDGNTNLAFSGAQIGSASSPVPAGSSQSVTFTVGNAGSYYYICQVDAHVSLGMWGSVTVNP